jgi:hypothetical protein
MEISYNRFGKKRIMIVSKTHFERKGERIKAMIFDEECPLEIILKKPKSTEYFDKEYYRKIYKQNFINYPVDIIPADDKTYLNTKLVMNFYRYYEIDSPVADDKRIIENAQNCDESSVIWDIDEIIDEKIHCMFYDFDKSLEAAKQSSWCLGITDHVLIIKNLLNHYINIKNNPEVMLSFFYGLSLKKEISNLLLDIYIEFLSDKLAMFTIDQIGMPSQVEIVSSKETKIKWKGKQAEIVELFVELQRKNWIESLDETGLAQSARIIFKIFDLSDTKRKKDSDIVQNINQLLKGEYNEKKERVYVFEKKGAIRKFKTITSN